MGKLVEQKTFEQELTYQQPFCAKFGEVQQPESRLMTRNSEDPKPEDTCLIWFDGLNDCLCVLGEITSILSKSSDTFEEPHCKVYID